MDLDTITVFQHQWVRAVELFDCLDRKPLKLLTNYIKGKHLLNDVPSHTINYGHIIDPESKEVVEEVMCLY